MEDTNLFNQEESDGIDALNLKWVIGFNKDIVNGVHNLTSQDRTQIFYTSAHTGVICNYQTREQRLLQGHCNKISCCTVSLDKRWIVTADLGQDSLMVVWDPVTGTPYKTISMPHLYGTYKLDMSSDGRFIATISNTTPQELIVWDWTRDTEDNEELMVVVGEIPMFGEGDDFLHYSIKFNTTNVYEIATNSARVVLFWQWDEEEQTLRYDDNEKEMKTMFRKGKEAFTQTVFIPNSTQAVTGTKNGHIVVWDMSFIMEADSATEKRRYIKIVQLVNTEVTFLTTQGPYLVVGSQDGAVRFYDNRFTVQAWFQHIKASSIMSISFADKQPRNSKQDLIRRGEYRQQNKKIDSMNVFACPDFIVASNNAKIIALKSTFFQQIPPANQQQDFVQGYTLVKGMRFPVTCVAIHPLKPIIALAGGRDQNNYIYFWNYRTRHREKFPPIGGKKILEQNKSQPLCMAYSPNGTFLCVGFSSGTFLLLDADNIHKQKQPQIKYTENARGITSIVFSGDGNAMATTDRENRVALFKWEHKRGNIDLPKQWVYCGSHKSHYKKITGVAFGESVDQRESAILKLFSVGDDRRLIEYDTTSTDVTQLEIISNTKIEQENKPTCCIWYPVSTGENLLLTMNDAHKIKLWNANNKDCRLTCLGPASAGPVTKIKLIVKQKQNRTAIDEPDYYLAYKIDQKIIGMIKLPVDGNPNKIMGLIGHPGVITDMIVSGDHKFLFTSGGDDLCVNMWLIDAESLQRQIVVSQDPHQPYQNMIEGGKEGRAYKDMKDFFYYSQIRSKKENTTQTRKLEGSVPLEQIGYLMRAMGYYPSQQEIDNMINQVKYSKFTDTGKIVNSLDLNTLLRVFVNHRPVYGISREEIKESFGALAGPDGVLQKEDLFELLMSKGEAMKEGELKGCLKSLLMPMGEENIEDLLPNEVNADFFIEKILGFEEVVDDEIEGDYEIVEVPEEYEEF